MSVTEPVLGTKWQKDREKSAGVCLTSWDHGEDFLSEGAGRFYLYVEAQLWAVSCLESMPGDAGGGGVGVAELTT